MKKYFKNLIIKEIKINIIIILNMSNMFYKDKSKKIALLI